jgi:hypothetical protein
MAINRTWQTITVGFSNLTEQQKELLLERINATVSKFETETDSTCEAVTTDSGEF